MLSIDFDPGPGTAILNSIGGWSGDEDIFIAHYDLNGNYLWAKSMGGLNEEKALDIAVDNVGNSYITGYFKDTVDFDPSVGVATFISNGFQDIFIAKYDTIGNYQWAHNFGGVTYGGEEGRCIVVDPTGVTVTGKFADTVDFDPGGGIFNLNSTTGQSIFIAKYDTASNLIWAGNIGGNNGPNIGENAYSLASDPSGNGTFYLTGNFAGTCDFDLTNGVYNLTSTNGSIFFSEYDVSGNLILVKDISSTGIAKVGRAVTTDAFGNISIGGSFSGTADYDPGFGVSILTSHGSSADLFLAKYDSVGNYLWAFNAGDFADDETKSISVDLQGNLYMTGHYSISADFDPGSGSALLTGTAGNATIFVAKYFDVMNNVFDYFPHTNQNILIFPNPAYSMISIKGVDPSLVGNKLCISDIDGRNVLETKVSEFDKINVSSFKPGIYLVTLYTSNQIQRAIFVRQ